MEAEVVVEAERTETLVAVRSIDQLSFHHFHLKVAGRLRMQAAIEYVHLGPSELKLALLECEMEVALQVYMVDLQDHLFVAHLGWLYLYSCSRIGESFPDS